jgi:sugar phosphate permease
MHELWKIPMVPEVAIAIFCLKTVRYTLYMWLPMYLSQQLGYSIPSAGMFSTMFEIGGILGSASNGFVLKKY